jgi:hypothetical protein
MKTKLLKKLRNIGRNRIANANCIQQCAGNIHTSIQEFINDMRIQLVQTYIITDNGTISNKRTSNS